MFVDDEGTGRKTFDEADSFNDLEAASRNRVLLAEYDRLRGAARCDMPLEDEEGASPNMKNLINAPISRTTDSWPSSRPCVNDSLANKFNLWT